MKSQYNLINRPHITEKVLLLKEEGNKVVFRIRKDTNKIELKNAIESMFNVTVEAINTLNVKGKKKRLGRHEGRKSDWKKAIVTVAEGQSIEFFEGV